MRVGYKLRREIRYLFPPTCTPAERLVGLEIADHAKEATRICLIEPDDLLALTGLSADGVSKALQRLLVKYGLQFRVVKEIGRDGRPVYTRRGLHPEYRVPTVDEFANAHDMTEGRTTVRPSLPGGRWLTVVDKPP